jgi:membrane-bound metal-dependent hydrolase YbcI (DUF457 family)
MALPIVHATAGYLLHRLDRRRAAFAGWQRALAFALVANLPDADFLVGFALGRPGAFHRGISHTVLAALLVGAAGGAIVAWRWHERWWRAGLVLTAVYASHLLVDALTIDERGPAGAQFFWPLSDAYFIFPRTIFGEIIIDGASRAGFLATVFAWPTVAVLARELAFAVVAIGTCNVLQALLPRLGGRDRRPVGLTAESGEEDLA